MNETTSDKMGWCFLESSMMGDTERGPLTNEQFAKLIEQKKITRKTQIQHPRYTRGGWIEARNVAAFNKVSARVKSELEAARERDRQVAVHEKQAIDATREREEQRADRKSVLQEAERKATEAMQFKPRRYPATLFIMVILRMSATLSLVAFAIGLVALMSSPEVGISLSVSAGIGAILQFAAAEGLEILRDIQTNTQQTAHYTKLSWQGFEED